jgi:hypothetical protein
MKQIILSLGFSLLLSCIGEAQCHPEFYGTLRSVVNANSVVLRNDTVYRDCASKCTMNLEWLSSDTVVWYQKEYQAGANCLCHYNLSVEIDSLAAGNYIALVYYIRMFAIDTCYIGFMRFVIGSPATASAPYKAGEYHSNCFPVVLTSGDKENVASLRVSPNPAVKQVVISTTLPGIKRFTLSDLTGQCLRSTTSDALQLLMDLGSVPASIYCLTVSNGEKVQCLLVCKR